MRSAAGECGAGEGRRRQSGRRWLAGVALAFLALAAGCATAPRARLTLEEVPAERRTQAEHNLRVFRAVWDLVNRKHYDPKLRGVDWERSAEQYGPRAIAAPDDAALYAVLNEMLAPLEDSHTHALTPAQVDERRTKLRARTGFGMLRVDGHWVVTDVLPGSPAEEAGVKSGWLVLTRNGQPLGENPDTRMREGEEVAWDFLDETGRQVRLSALAKRLSVAPRQLARVLEDGYVYLRFDEFDGTDRRWLSRQLKAHAAAPGVIIDLRQNPGGETFSLGISIGEFFDRPVDCGTFVSREGGKRVKNSWQLGSARYLGPVAVLIDGGTGSAAEIFAAVLQDHGRAVVIGRRSAGAVLASWFYALPGGGELQLSRLDYYAPKGRRIERTGVEPDLVVARVLPDIRAGRDRDVAEAVRVLRAQAAPAAR